MKHFALLLALTTVLSTVFTQDPEPVPEYVYYNMRTWEKYISTDAPNCNHVSPQAYKYAEANKHSVFCRDCGVIFTYEDCYIDNDRYCAPADYNHNRCLVCLHKQ